MQSKENMWAEGIFQGKTYMYPFYHLPNTMVYNADLFRQAGLDRYPNIHDLLNKKKTPEQAAADIDKDCNIALKNIP